MLIERIALFVKAVRLSLFKEKIMEVYEIKQFIDKAQADLVNIRRSL